MIVTLLQHESASVLEAFSFFSFFSLPPPVFQMCDGKEVLLEPDSSSFSPLFIPSL